MRDSTPYRLSGLRLALGTVFRRFGLLAPLLLMLDILVGCDRPGPHAQRPEDEETKAAELLGLSPPTAPDRPSSAPQQIGEDSNLRLPSPSASTRSRRRIQFKIDPETPLKDLLPTPPKIPRTASLVRSNDLSCVPEVRFEALPGRTNTEARKHIAHQIAKINHLNNQKADGFIEALQSERPDLSGLPFAMGDACRTKGERSKQFAIAVTIVRQALRLSATAQGAHSLRPPRVKNRISVVPTNNVLALPGSSPVISAPGPHAADDPPPPETFWEEYQTLCTKEDKAQAQVRCEQREMITLTRIAALTQILMPMTQMHRGLVRYLSTVSHVESTRSLARLAIFSTDGDARKASVKALRVRSKRDYTEILANGLRYPWPAVTQRAAEAIAKLERYDLLPQLIDVLEQADPRAPVTQEVKGKSVAVVHELVRVNHHRSCLLCHAPGNNGKVSVDAVTAEVPVPGQPLNPPSGNYNTSRQDILVRVDVTYLRQDFSKYLDVADADPWPVRQRFDFLVRKRVLSQGEAATFREKLKPREQGGFSPYQRAALAALRALTGRDTEPTPQAWRRLLKLPAEKQHKPKT